MTTTTPQLAGHLLVDCLLAQGVTHAFGVPGESYLAVLDGLYARRGQIRFITCRQEGGAAFMAEAHGKLTGRPGVCMVTRGPGATNASIGVHTAFQDSTPMVLLVGDVASDCRDREAFQEVDYSSFFGPSTKGFAKRVERIDAADLTNKKNHRRRILKRGVYADGRIGRARPARDQTNTGSAG